MIVNNPPSDATAPKTVLYIDNRIVKSRLPTCTLFHMQKCHQFHDDEKWRTLRKTDRSPSFGGRRNMLRHSSRAEVNKFLLARVILFKRVYFRQHVVCLIEKIFNCCNVFYKQLLAEDWKIIPTNLSDGNRGFI